MILSKRKYHGNWKLVFLTLMIFVSFSDLLAQENGRREASFFEDFGSNLWVGSYNQLRITEKLYYRLEFHYRRGGHNDIPYVGRMSQIYNRHAFNYFFSERFNVSFGGVVRLNFTPDPGNDEFEFVLPEPRFWHEYLWVMPFP